MKSHRQLCFSPSWPDSLWVCRAFSQMTSGFILRRSLNISTSWARPTRHGWAEIIKFLHPFLPGGSGVCERSNRAHPDFGGGSTRKKRIPYAPSVDLQGLRMQGPNLQACRGLDVCINMRPNRDHKLFVEICVRGRRPGKFGAVLRGGACKARRRAQPSRLVLVLGRYGKWIWLTGT